MGSEMCIATKRGGPWNRGAALGRSARRENRAALSGTTARQEGLLLYTSPFIDPIHLVWVVKKTQQLEQ